MKMIRRDGFNTPIPSNVNLEDLVHKGDDEYTDAALSRAKCQLLYLARGTREGFDEIMARLPSFFVDRDEGLERKHGDLMIQRLIFGIGIVGSYLSLRRGVFLDLCNRAQKLDGEGEETVLSVVRAADRVLDLVREIDEAGLPARRWWGVLVQAYRSCIYLLIYEEQKVDILGEEAGMDGEREQKVNMVIELLSNAKNVIGPANKASLVLQKRLNEVQANGGKRLYGLGLEGGEDKMALVPDASISPHHPAPAPNGIDSTEGTKRKKKDIWNCILDLEVDVEVKSARARAHPRTRGRSRIEIPEEDEDRRSQIRGRRG